MKFKVKRTSQWDENSPCEEAYEDKYMWIHVRTCKTFEEFNERFAWKEGEWTSKGKNHRLVSEGIARDEDESKTGWFIIIDSIEGLMAFKEKYGDLVIQNAFDNPSIPEIEIYDGYRE